MASWRIYYTDSVVDGDSQEDWIAAPNHGVQVVVLFKSYGAPHLSPWAGVWDRHLWTGEDEYDPFGWGVKYGQWMSDESYHLICEQACGN